MVSQVVNSRKFSSSDSKFKVFSILQHCLSLSNWSTVERIVDPESKKLASSLGSAIYSSREGIDWMISQVSLPSLHLH